MKNWLTKEKIFIVIACLSFGFLITFGFLENTIGAGAAGSAILMFLIFAHLNQFSEFKIFGGSAKLNKTLDEARATVAQLRALAISLAKAAANSIATQGRFFQGDGEHFKIISDIETTLEHLEISKEDIQSVFSIWYSYKNLDHVLAILGGTQTPSHLGTDLVREWKELRSKPPNNTATPDQLTEFLQAANLLTVERTERVEDYRYFLAKRSLRRPEEWKRRSEWNLDSQ